MIHIENIKQSEILDGILSRKEYTIIDTGLPDSDIKFLNDWWPLISEINREMVPTKMHAYKLDVRRMSFRQQQNFTWIALSAKANSYTLRHTEFASYSMGMHFIMEATRVELTWSDFFPSVIKNGRDHVKNLSKFYVRKVLNLPSNIQAPDNLIELKKSVMTINRKLKSKNYESQRVTQ